MSAGAGDNAAVDQLLDQHRAPLRRLIEARLDPAIAPRVDASDVVQNVLLDASRRISEFLRDNKMPFHLWLRQLAKDRMIDAYRQHHAAECRSVKREERIDRASPSGLSSYALAARLCDPELTPAAALIRQELQQRMQSVLDRLEETDRELLIMRHVEQLSNSDIALTLGITPPAAGMRYLRILRRLREELGPESSALLSGQLE